MWHAFKKHRAVRLAASFDVTVICLSLLMILTFWGTLYQVEHGLYAAQQRMFRSWYFLALGFIPIPGAKTVLWFTFVNLVFSGLTKYSYQWRKAGLILVHYGMLLLIISAGFTYYFAQESVLSLSEGEASNVSDDYHEWEIAAWRQSRQGDSVIREGQTLALSSLQVGQTIEFRSVSAKLNVEAVFTNCRALMGAPNPGFQANEFNINELVPQKEASDAAENTPGVIVGIPGSSSDKLLIYGGAPTAYTVETGGKPTFLAVRRVKHALPITMRLIDFRKSEHPGTEKARSFESDVEISRSGVSKKTNISMNKPYREAGFTFYQASFSQSNQGETSTFAVVENKGRVLPYICCLLVGAGLLLHFVIMLFQFARRKQAGESHAQ